MQGSSATFIVALVIGIVPFAPAAVASGCNGKRVAPDANLHRVIDGESGKTFCLSRGTYRIGKSPLTPGRNVVIWGSKGTRSSRGAINAPTKIVGSARTAIVKAGENNTFRWLDVSGSRPGGSCQPDCGRGIRSNAGTIVAFSRLHHNSNNGIGSGIPAKVTVRFSELDHNGRDTFKGTYGGLKQAATTNGGVLEVTHSYVHDNTGVGLWVDRCQLRMVVKHNRVVRNSRDGIRWETSMRPGECPNTRTRSAVIHNNRAKRNGTDPTEPGDAGIEIRNSPNADVAYNVTKRNEERGIRVVHDSESGSIIGNRIRKNRSFDGIYGCNFNSVTCSGNKDS
jgi:hypothetical protein